MEKRWVSSSILIMVFLLVANLGEGFSQAWAEKTRAEEAKPVIQQGETPPAPGKTTKAKKIVDVSLGKKDDLTQITIVGDGEFGKYETLKLGSPPRLVLDVKDVGTRLARVLMKNKNPFIKEVRIGKHPDRVRLVFYPEGSQVPPYQIERKKDRLVVSFGTSSKMADAEVAFPPSSGSKTTMSETVSGVKRGAGFKPAPTNEAKIEAPAMAAQPPTPESKRSETPGPSEPGKGPTALLNVDQLVEEALQNNPEILAAKKKWEAFKEKIPQAYAFEDPMISLGIISLPTNFSFRKEDMTMKEISVSQKFPFPGKRPLMKEMAEKEAEAVYTEVQGKIQQVVREVKAAYYELSHVYQATEVIRRNKEILETFARIAETRYSVGEGIQQDAIKAHVEVSKMVDELLMQNQRQRALDAKLNALLNRPPETPGGKPEEVVFRKLPFRVEELQQMALEMNPALKGMKKMIEAKEKAYDLAKREYYPDFNFKFAYGQRDNGPEMKRRDMFTGMMEINIPIFYKSKQDRKVAETKADILSAEAQYRAMKNEIFFMIADMTSMIHRVERQIELYKTGIIPQAGLQVASAMSAYRVNKADFLTLLDSQMTLYKYELEYHQGLTEFEKNVASLGSVIGKQLFQRGEGK